MRVVATLHVVLALSAMCFVMLRDLPGHSFVRNFNYGESTFQHYERIRKEFRPRVASTLAVRVFHTADAKEMRKRSAGYFTLLFALTCMLYLWLDVKAAPFLMVGTFAGVSYACSRVAEFIWHPWDFPALFLGALAIVLALKRRFWATAATVLVGVAFKETLLLYALLLPFIPKLSLRTRLISTLTTIAGGLGLRFAIERATRNPHGFDAFSYNINANPKLMFRWEENLNWLLETNWNHILFVNLGTFLLVFFLPTRHPVLRAFKWGVVPLFYVGLFVAGSYNEFRVFLEAMPGALILLYGTLHGQDFPRFAAARA